MNSWLWTDELSETCRVSWKNKFVKLVRLVGFIIKKNSRYSAKYRAIFSPHDICNTQIISASYQLSLSLMFSSVRVLRLRVVVLRVPSVWLQNRLTGDDRKLPRHQLLWPVKLSQTWVRCDIKKLLYFRASSMEENLGNTNLHERKVWCNKGNRNALPRTVQFVIHNFMFEFLCIITLYYIKNQQDGTLAVLNLMFSIPKC